MPGVARAVLGVSPTGDVAPVLVVRELRAERHADGTDQVAESEVSIHLEECHVVKVPSVLFVHLGVNNLSDNKALYYNAQENRLQPQYSILN